MTKLPLLPSKYLTYSINNCVEEKCNLFLKKEKKLNKVGYRIVSSHQLVDGVLLSLRNAVMHSIKSKLVYIEREIVYISG